MLVKQATLLIPIVALKAVGAYNVLYELQNVKATK